MRKRLGRKKFVDRRFAKGKEYRAVIEAIAKERVCPFCPENFRWHKNPILKRRGAWFITKSSWPYKNTKFHFIILTLKHKENFGELSQQDWKQIISLAKWAISKFEIKGGGLAMRFGETVYTGATVCHLHAHLIVPQLKPDKRTAKTVMFPIG